MLTAVQGGFGGDGGCSCLWRRRPTRLKTARTRLVLVRMVRGLMLRVSRLWRWHAVIMHWAEISARTICPVRHQRTGARRRTIHAVSWGWSGRPSSGGRRCRPVIVGVCNPRWCRRGREGLLVWRGRRSVVQRRRRPCSHHRASWTTRAYRATRAYWTSLTGRFRVSHLLLLAWAGLAREWPRSRSSERFPSLFIGIWRLGWGIYLREACRPVA